MPLAKINTTIVNTSGVRMYFDFIPPTGGYLDADAEFSHPGNITEWLRKGSPGTVRLKQVEALNYALDNHLIEIKETPAPIFYDSANERSRELFLSTTLQLRVPSSVPTTTTAAPTTTPAPTTTGA